MTAARAPQTIAAGFFHFLRERRIYSPAPESAARKHPAARYTTASAPFSTPVRKPSSRERGNMALLPKWAGIRHRAKSTTALTRPESQPRRIKLSTHRHSPENTHPARNSAAPPHRAEGRCATV